MKSAELARHFEDLFGSPPRIFRAPGRVNLLGEHTDYNDGFVMPCAIGFSTRVAIFPRQDRKLVIRSEEFSEQYEFDLDNLPSRSTGVWSDYVLGIAVMLRQMGHLTPGEPAGSRRGADWRGTQFFGGDRGRQRPCPHESRRRSASSARGREAVPEERRTCLSARGSASWTSLFPAWERRGTPYCSDRRSLEFKLIPLPENPETGNLQHHGEART